MLLRLSLFLCQFESLKLFRKSLIFLCISSFCTFLYFFSLFLYIVPRIVDIIQQIIYIISFLAYQYVLSGNSILCSYLTHFSARTPKNKKSLPQKNSLYIRTWNFLALISKKFLYFHKRKHFLYFLKWNPTLSSPSSKNKKIHLGKYTSGNGNLEKFLVFSRKKAVLIFQETESFKKVYSGKVYSEP